jgi:hypothetical protein
LFDVATSYIAFFWLNSARAAARNFDFSSSSFWSCLFCWSFSSHSDSGTQSTPHRFSVGRVASSRALYCS